MAVTDRKAPNTQGWANTPCGTSTACSSNVWTRRCEMAYTHITNDMQRGAAEKIGGFMETATAKPEPESPDPPEESRCKVIPFERVG